MRLHDRVKNHFAGLAVRTGGSPPAKRLSPAAELGAATLVLGLALVSGLYAVDGYAAIHHGPAGELTVTRCRDGRFVTCYGTVRLTSGRVLREVRLEGDAARVGTRLRVVVDRPAFHAWRPGSHDWLGDATFTALTLISGAAFAIRAFAGLRQSRQGRRLRPVPGPTPLSHPVTRAVTKVLVMALILVTVVIRVIG